MAVTEPPSLTGAEQEAWRKALNAAYKARGCKVRAGRPFKEHDLWNVHCIRAARALFPSEEQSA